VAMGILGLPLMADEEKAEPAEGQAKVQLAILLDTSNSMDGLIEQAKTQLWRIVNTFIDAKQNGRVPFVEVALYEYGNSGLAPRDYWIRQVQPLTRDLDKISEELFALRTNGGQEFCGAVIKRATGDLEWDPSPDVYKAVFIAGNEPFTQGPVDASESCRGAIAKGVIVNTIHCGDEATGIAGGWKEGAVLADGSFLIIDSNKAVVHIEAPQDAEIVRLNEELNKTYLAYGREGQAGAANQVAQDANAMAKAEAGAAVQRAVAKASVNYSNARWDLVDARDRKDFDWADVRDEDLPEELRALSNDERDAKIAAMREQREKIQAEIATLNKQREQFVADKLKEAGEGAEDTLDAVVTRTVREQAVKKGYDFEK
jgi:hypothetical protein